MQYGIRKSAPRMGILLISVAILALALFTTSTMASPKSGIVIQGPKSTSSHLKLTVEEGGVVVNGTLEYGEQAGCEITHGHNALSCPLAGASQVEMDMGSSADTVEVLDALPVPLIVHLGDGSDKFIGNEEADTCYTEGDANNSCDSGGGNDVCITASVTTKCIGGPGNDTCKVSDSGNACYGGPGNDTCKMGPGEGKCLGEGGNDHLFGESGSDHLSGGPGSDYLYGGSSSDKLYGDIGDDHLYGESSSDKLYGGPGADYIDGGTSPDKLYGESGNDHLLGGPSPDKLYGASGTDFCDGGPGVGRSYLCENGPEK